MPYSHSGGVHEALVEVFQSFVRLFFLFKPHKAELAELAVLGELQRAVCHGAKGREQGPEPVLLHLDTRGSHFTSPRWTEMRQNETN